LRPLDLYYLKGVAGRLLTLLGIPGIQWHAGAHPKMEDCLRITSGKTELALMGAASASSLARFDIKQPVWVADFNWEQILLLVRDAQTAVKELPRQLPVQRDLALVVSQSTPYEALEASIRKIKLEKLQGLRLFDVFESDKLGVGKKSMAVSFTFLDPEKTLTDKEVDAMMEKIMAGMEKDLAAEIRR
jgi:phenylalanyl-tRNA synthetase beta chain